MIPQTPPPKIITVSGLYSGIGKTLLSEHIVRLVPGMAAIKITINDHVTQVLDDEALIMVAGKDTWRLTKSGAARVVWVQAQEEHLDAALADAIARCRPCPRLLIEGNSMLEHLTPAVAVFVCDSRICADKPPKPSRAAALAKADIIINNKRPGLDAAEAEVEKTLRQYNQAAPVYFLDIACSAKAQALMRDLLQARGFPV